MSQRTTESDKIGDVWSKHDSDDLIVTGKFNDWCLLARFDGESRVGVWALKDLAEFGYTRRAP